MTLQPIKAVWVCVDDKGYIAYGTFAVTKDLSKIKLTDDVGKGWEWCKSIGFKCIQVDATFKQS